MNTLVPEKEENVLVKKIENILINTLPEGCYIHVSERKILGDPFIRIAFAAKDYDINGVKNQKPQIVSLSLELPSLELQIQSYGCSGGQKIFREPNMDHPKEKYLAMKSEKVPFRKPKKEEKFVLSAIERFANNWLKTLRAHKDVLKYKDIVDYDKMLS